MIIPAFTYIVSLYTFKRYIFGGSSKVTRFMSRQQRQCYQPSEWRLIMVLELGKRITFIVIALGLCVLGGCNGDDATVIRYEQVLNFNVFDPDPAAQPHNTYGGGFAMYKITSFDNSKRSDPFNFQVNKVYGQPQTNSGWNVSWQHHVLGAPWRATDKVVAGNSQIGGIGCLIIGTSGYLGDAFQTLHYRSTGNESVLLIREGGGNPPKPDTAGTVYPHILAQKCN